MLLATTRRLAGTMVLAALALGFTACGADSQPRFNQDEALLSPAQLVFASYEELRGKSYKMESTITMNGLTFVEATSVVNGEAIHSTQDVYLSAVLEAADEELPDDPELADMMGVMFGDIQTESILIDGVFYMQVSGGMYAAMTAQYGTDAWFTLDLATQADLNEVFAEIGGFDLASQTETLLNDLTDVEETSHGVYAGSLRVDSEPMLAIISSIDTTGGAGQVGAIDTVITVDDQGLLRSMEMTIPEVEGLAMHIASTIVEVGGQYDIAAPEGNVHPFEELLGAMA